MKKLYWAIQNLDTLGGSEMVSINLANSLCNDFDITLIVVSKVTNEIVYKIDPKIRIINLGINPKLVRLNNYTKKYNDQHRYLASACLAIRCVLVMFLGRWHYRKKIKKLIDKDPGLLICSSGETYMFAPKKVAKLYHYHFNSRLFFSFGDKFILAHSHKPNQFVFLSKTTRDVIVNKRKDLLDCSTYVYNPVRFESLLDTTYHNNSIAVVGRLIQQKNPMLALGVANELKTMNINFKMTFYGNGALKDEMVKYIKENELDAFVELVNETPGIKEAILNSDLLLLTSIYEGYPLVKGEANALSRPIISSNWGDTVYEIVHEGLDGYVIDSYEAKDYALKIKELFMDKDRLKTLKKTSYESSLNCSIEKIKLKWLEIINKY